MKIGNFDTDKKVFIIAEIGNNHEGSFTLAEEMIEQAAKTGANAVKFQTIIPEKLVSIKQTKRIEQLKKFQFTFEQFTELSQIAAKNNIDFLSTPFDLESADFLKSIVPAYKIASGDNTFFPLLETIAKTGKPIIMSTGMTSIEEITQSKEYIENIWQRQNINQKLALLHCVVSYPTPIEAANLKIIQTLKQELNCTIGYSDHVMGPEAAIYSVALGARIVEKHFTIDKNYSDFRDHQLSADPKELSYIVEHIRELERFLGCGQKIIQPQEEAALIPVRRSIIAAKDLEAGTKIQLQHILWVRPGDGLKPGQEDKIIGKVLCQNIPQGEQITLESLE